MMKKTIGLFLGVLMVFTLSSCSTPNNGAVNGASSEGTQSSIQQKESSSESSQESLIQQDDTSEEPSLESGEVGQETEAGKALVVYYSASGHTEAVAGYIADAADADLFELVPVEPYSNADLNWTDDDSRVVYEHDHPGNRDVELVETTVDHWDAYDTIFIGYPIWWGIAAWPVDGFIVANDFTGKTVVPFCTSSSSGLGESSELLEEMAGTGKWKEGRRFSSGVSEGEVRAWVEELGLLSPMSE